MPSSESVLHALHKYCCCTVERNDDTDNLLVADNNEDWNYARPHNNGSTVFAGTVNARNVTSGSVQPEIRTREEEDEDTLNKILDRTQQNIIDVSHLDNGSQDIDILQRARLYSEAIKRHDIQVDKRKAAHSGNGGSQPRTSISPDVEGQINELLKRGHDKVDKPDIDMVSKLADGFIEAYSIGPQIECKEELIVYMSLDE